MNKEEAIKAIQDFIGWFKTDSRIYKALKMAIQALSQELCEWGKMTFDAISGMSIFEFSDGTVKRVKQAELEPCEDAISRDAVIKIIEDAETARLRGDIDLLYAPILKKLNELTSVNPQPCDDAISRILKRMWNCRGKHTTSIDKVKMEQIIRDDLSPVTKKTLECNDTVSRGVFEQVMRERDIAIEQLHELGYELGQKIEPCEDAISRSDMLDAVGHGTTYTSEEVQKIVNNLSPVTPQQKTGHWIHFAQSDDCSECGWSTGKYISPSNYCPNCGAKMESEV